MIILKGPCFSLMIILKGPYVLVLLWSLYILGPSCNAYEVYLAVSGVWRPSELCGGVVVQLLKMSEDEKGNKDRGKWLSGLKACMKERIAHSCPRLMRR